MAALFRATVMLLVLVGLPAAWIYYGPLPPEAMGVIQRTVATAKQSLGWNDPTRSESWGNRSIAAPKFEVLSTAPPAQPTRQDPQFSLASANLAPPPSVPSPANVEVDAEVDAELAKQLEPHLSLLRALDASEYTLENWGGSAQLYRFRCEITLGENGDFTRQFEAIDASPLRAVHQVVGEVTSWQNARQGFTASRWQ